MKSEKELHFLIGAQEKRIIHLFDNHRLTHPYVNAVYMGRENGSFVRSHLRARPTRYDPRDRPWYQLAKNNPDKIMLTDAYMSVTTPDVNIGAVKALSDEKGEVYGVVGIDVTLVNLTQFLANYRTNPPGHVLLTDHNPSSWQKKYLCVQLDTCIAQALRLGTTC